MTTTQTFTYETGDQSVSVRNEAPAVRIDGNVATLRLYDTIDSWGERFGVSAGEFSTVLDEIPSNVDEIHLRINSPGGEVYEGLAIMNALRAHPARVVAFVDGIAASAASTLAVSADELVMSPNSELMIHEAWGMAVGNASDLRSMADNLDRHSDNIASIYAARAEGDVAFWRAAMAAESWYSAQEAVDAGLADRIDGADDDGARNAFDLSAFKYANRAEAPAPKFSTEPPDPSPVENSTGDDDPAGDVVPSTVRKDLVRLHLADI